MSIDQNNDWKTELACFPDDVKARLLEYLHRGPSLKPVDCRKDDEPFAADWRRQLAAFEERDLNFLEILREAYPVIRCADSVEIQAAEASRNPAVSGSISPGKLSPLIAPSSTSLTIEMAETAAGAIPVIRVPDRREFVWLLTCLTRRNHDNPVPPTQGAAFLSGLTNWGRLNRHRVEWCAQEPSGTWEKEFERVRSVDNWEFRDRVIVVSSGAYGGIDSGTTRWIERLDSENSIRIRIEHECVHYCFRRWRGSVSGTLSEEIVADFVALREVLGPRVDISLMKEVLGLGRKHSESPRYLTYIPEPLLPFADLIRRIALSGCRELAASYDGEWHKEDLIRNLEPWSLGGLMVDE